MEKAEQNQLTAVATKKKLSRFRNSVAGIYFAWSTLQFFGSMGSDAHSWWPLTLYPLIWPLSFGIHQISRVGLNFFDPKGTQFWLWDLNDWVSGLLYIFGGTAWLCLLSTLLFKTVARKRNGAATIFRRAS